MKFVELFTDGACSGNPGPGGWGAILKYNGREKELSGGEENTTNNRMELTAVIEGLKALKEPCEVKIVTELKKVDALLENITNYEKIIELSDNEIIVTYYYKKAKNTLTINK